MGAAVSKVLSSVLGPLVRLGTQKQTNLAILGLDAAGKTTLLYRCLPQEEIETTVPTIGFSLERAKHKSVNIMSWDIGGGCKLWPLWRHYLADVHGLIFIVDSIDRDRMPEARDELYTCLNQDVLEGVPLLVLANKQDLPHPMSAREVASALALPHLRGHAWHVQPCSVRRMDGVPEGIDWLHKAIIARRRQGLPAASSGAPTAS